MGIKEKLDFAIKRIKEAAERASRNPDEVKLVAVTKYSEPEQITEAINAGVRIIGENRIQESIEKFGKIPKTERHFIGSLQTNKARYAISYFDVIESVDSLKLAGEIDKEAKKIGKIMPVFAEVNVGREESKHGVMPEDTEEFCNKIMKFTNLRLDGLMCIAPYFPPEEIEKTRKYFRQMNELKKKIGLKYLSMGMSNDFEIAIEEGADFVRIGRLIFGEDN